ncbi:MAG: DUF402 domain-containing protein [Clostridia bacterium]|nr:DUF402 domain-containing protein [Clostridia bacterium]
MINGYYIIECTPLKDFYNTRIFLDNNANVLVYYFDISKGNGIENNIPYYDDLYLDVIYSEGKEGIIRVEDEDELTRALNDEIITLEEYNLACETCENLIKNIKDKQNLFVNMDKKSLIQKYF